MSSNKLTARLPSDLARIAGKGVDAMDAFLDLRTKEGLSEDEFQRSHAFAEIGSRAVGFGLRYMQAANNAAAIELQRKRLAGGA